MDICFTIDFIWIIGWFYFI